MQFQFVVLATLFAATQAVPRAAPAIPKGWVKVSEPSQGEPWCIVSNYTLYIITIQS